MKKYIALIISFAMLTGCASVVVPSPGKITLEEALKSVGRGLVAMKNAEIEENNGKEFKTGLMASEAEVTFNVVASGTQDAKLYVEITPVSGPVSGKAGANIGTSYNAARGNQITIKFRSIAFSKKTTTSDGAVIIEGPTDPATLEKILAVLKTYDIPVMYKSNNLGPDMLAPPMQ